MKLELNLKQHKDNQANLKAVNEKIEQLKKEFNKKKYNHIGELYELLKKIVELKKATRTKYKERYTERSLEWEEGLSLSGSQIRYIFAYQYISGYSKQKVLEGKIDDATLCHALAVSTLLRDPIFQKKFVDKLINKKIKPSAISELSKEDTKNFLNDKLVFREDDNYFLYAIKSLRNIKQRIFLKKHLLKKSPYKTNLIASIKSLYNLVKDLEDEENA